MFGLKVTELLESSEDFELVVQARRLQGQVSVSLQVTPFTEFTQIELIMAGFVLVGLYVLIIFELCHRTLAAMLGKSRVTDVLRNSVNFSIFGPQHPSSPSNRKSLQTVEHVELTM